MKYTTALFAAGAFVAAVSSVPVRRGVPANLIPAFGVTAGTDPDGTGNCVGINNILIPCSCPPDLTTFTNDLNANVAAGHAVNNPSIALSFPTDSSQASQVARIQAAIVTLQNLNGPGVGCPAASTTFSAQLAAAQAGTASPPAAAAPAPAPAAAPAPAPAAAADSSSLVPASLIPAFGVTAGTSPDGTGNCVGINGILIPCSCPPDLATFTADLNANVAAGHAVNNPSVALSFPTGSSASDAATRIEAAIITLQNLNGPGVGCPAASTTFSAQLAAAQAAE